MTKSMTMAALAGAVLTISSLAVAAAPTSPSVAIANPVVAAAGDIETVQYWRWRRPSCEWRRVVDWRWGRRTVRWVQVCHRSRHW